MGPPRDSTTPRPCRPRSRAAPAARAACAHTMQRFPFLCCRRRHDGAGRRPQPVRPPLRAGDRLLLHRAVGWRRRQSEPEHRDRASTPLRGHNSCIAAHAMLKCDAVATRRPTHDARQARSTSHEGPVPRPTDSSLDRTTAPSSRSVACVASRICKQSLHKHSRHSCDAVYCRSHSHYHSPHALTLHAIKSLRASLGCDGSGLVLSARHHRDDCRPVIGRPRR